MTASPNGVFGTIVSAHQIQETALAAIKFWMPRYLVEVERQNDLPNGSFQMPTNWSTRNEVNLEVGERLPKIVVTSPGLAGPPQKYNAKQYRATWNLGVGIAVASQTEEKADMTAKVYGSAVRAILLKRDAMVPMQAKVEWVNEDYTPPAISYQNQKLKVASVFFTISLENVVTAGIGPDSPDSPDHTWPLVETVEIDLIKESIDG